MRTTNTHLLLWEWMREYQNEHGMPPTLDEIRDSMDALSHRSSVRYILTRMKAMRMVELIREKGCARRYRAIGRKDAGEGRENKAEPCTGQVGLLADNTD